MVNSRRPVIKGGYSYPSQGFLDLPYIFDDELSVKEYGPLTPSSQSVAQFNIGMPYTPEMKFGGLAGAVGGGANDTAPFNRALVAAVAAGKKLVLTQDLAITQIWNSDIKPLWIDFAGFTLTVTPPDANGALVLLSPSTTLTLGAGGILRNSNLMNLTDTSTVAEGSLITLSNTIIAESARGTFRRQTFRVMTVENGTQVTVSPPANFVFDPANSGMTVTHYATPRTVILEKPKFKNLTPNTIVYRSALLGGIGKTRINDLEIDSPSVTLVSQTGACSDGIFFSNCNDVVVDRAIIRGQRYGIKPDASNNVILKNITSNCNRHPISPSSWSTGVQITTLRGENNICITDCHESFNVDYDDVETTTDVEVSNHRSCGGSLTNSRIRSLHPSQATQMQTIIFVAADGVTPDPQYYADHDFYVDNVEWHAPAGFTVDRARNCVVNNLRMTNNAVLTLGAAAGYVAKNVVGRDVNYSSSSVFNGTVNVLPNFFGTGSGALPPSSGALTIRYASQNDRPFVYGAAGCVEAGMTLQAEAVVPVNLKMFSNGGTYQYIQQLQSNGDIILGGSSDNFFQKLTGANGDLIMLGTRSFRMNSSSGPIIKAGTGSPEGAVTAPIGSIFMRSDGGAGTSHYIKESGAGNTGWVAK